MIGGCDECAKEKQVKGKLMKFGGLYLAYEVVSTALLFVIAAYGFNVPGF